jgi:hypothetical protein
MNVFTSKQFSMKAMSFLAVLLFGVAQGAWAVVDEAAVEKIIKENKELRETVEKLTSKVDRIEGRVESLPQGAGIAAASVSGGQAGDGVLRTQGGDIRMSGFIDSSFNWNLGSPGTGASAGPAPAGTNSTGNTTLRAFDREADTFDLNSIQLTMERPAPSDGGVGFKTEFTYGTDAQVIESTGFLAGTDEFSIQEAYVDIKVPVGTGLTVWAGKFATLIGAEVIENHLNWNSSRSFLFLLAQPATHTGVRAMYSFLDGEVQTALGLVNGWDNAIDNNEPKDVEAMIKWVPNENFFIAENFIVGSQTADDHDRQRWLFDTIAGWTPLPQDLPKLKLMANFDYGFEERLGSPLSGPAAAGGTTGEGGPAEWIGYALYVKYELTDKVTLAARWEQFYDDQAVRTGALGAGNPVDELYEMTYTVDYKVWDNLLTRLEYRYDRANETSDLLDRNGPFDQGTEDDQSTVGLSAIYLFG